MERLFYLGFVRGPVGPGEAVWTLGRYGRGLNIIAVAFAGLICVVLVMPPNENAGYLLVGIATAALLGYQRMKRTYRGPA